MVNWVTRILDPLLIQMAKRKIDCSLNDFIIDFLKKRKYERTLKLCDDKNYGPEKENTKYIIYENFINYVIGGEFKKETEIDDLGFEINFGAFQTDTRVSFQIVPQIM